ncbi:reverse transcriptase [Gossypium australe]|uniref:Reverse transcriptase n=1 Tax=Gossypium australe TaxID=47621 RepID=A0A5B6X9M2_9ROSI|nr:reverse transcriptase [Gossypium australe]
METKLSTKRMEMVRLKCGFENGIEAGAIEVWRLTGFYGNPDGRGRSASWDLLRQLSHDQTTSWVVLGDFNEITSSFEKKGGRLRSERKMNEFRTTLEGCNLNGLGFVGRWFTWERGRFLASNIWERLDRGVATLNWDVDCNNGVLLEIEWKGKKRVTFEERLNYLYSQEPSDEILAEITDVQMKLNWEADKEELFWEQRARVNWLKNGDRNTSYFHKVAVNCQFRGRIIALEDENGRKYSSTEDILRLASDYFINLFSASSMGSDEHLFGLVEKKVTESMNAALLKQFT